MIRRRSHVGHRASHNPAGTCSAGLDPPGSPPDTGLVNVETESTENRELIVSAVVERLAHRYPEAPRRHITDVVNGEYDALDEGRIRTYIPTLVEHSARGRLHREFARRPGES